MRIIGTKYENIIRSWCECSSITSTKAEKISRINSALRRKTLLTCMLSVLGVFGTLATASAHSASKTVLVLGDSLSAEYGLPRGSGWVALLEQRLHAQHMDINITNASISGETTSGGSARLPALLKQRPDIVIIELGANDALRGLQLKATESNLRAMILTAQKASAKVLLIGMRIPPNYGRDYTEKFFGMYPTLAKQTNVTLVPFLLDGIAEKPQLFQADRIHPTAQAHPIILNNVWQKLQPLIKTVIPATK